MLLHAGVDRPFALRSSVTTLLPVCKGQEASRGRHVKSDFTQRTTAAVSRSQSAKTKRHMSMQVASSFPFVS